MDMDLDAKFHIHVKPDNVRARHVSSLLRREPNGSTAWYDQYQKDWKGASAQMMICKSAYVMSALAVFRASAPICSTLLLSEGPYKFPLPPRNAYQNSVVPNLLT